MDSRNARASGNVADNRRFLRDATKPSAVLCQGRSKAKNLASYSGLQLRFFRRVPGSIAPKKRKAQRNARADCSGRWELRI